ncbi:hypothetical protein KC19_3G108100 [Ceratodon purpureus]|uniref:RBR-type E3 ubiquitin transferase n=1 Tax=Ceratodon purpureus TaxID=3225 RepID=A0A8T0IH19_CERPU|nr:hypothetical protein KC19_3G108100 [Ceratodon purpureus]
MEKITVSKMQAVEMAKGIVEARDEKLAFLLQLQEIVKSTTVLDHEFASCEDLEEEPPSPPLLSDSEIDADKDKDVALKLAADELGNLVEETEETQLSLLETYRLAHLDAIQEHDAQFARSIENTPSEDWENAGDEMEDPFDDFHGPDDMFAYNEVDHQYDSVVTQFGGAATSAPRKRSHGGDTDGEKNLLVLRRAKLPTSVNLREMPRRVVFNPEQQDKGKKVVQEDDDDYLPASPLSVGRHSPGTSAGTVPFLGESLEVEDRDATVQTDDHVDDTELAQKICQICFEAPLSTSTSFVSLEGCRHEFCKTCISRHAEARIVDGGLMHIACPYVGCQTIISFTQLSSLLNSKMLEILSRRQIEAAIPDSERVYCPFKDCSALLFKPSTPTIHQPSSSARRKQPTAFGCVECDACHRAFCMECNVPWHADMSCIQYKGSLRNRRLLGDEKLLHLASEKKWQRCKCGHVVELEMGCYHVRCVCGHGFCYLCGVAWIKKDKKPCTCPMWSESKL